MPRTISLRLREESPESLVFKRIRRRYGHFARPRPAETGSDPSRLRVPIIAEIPVQIADRVTDRVRIAWIALGEVAEADLARSPLTLLEMPSAPSFRKAARERYRAISMSVEADMVASAPFQFGELTFAKFFLQTLRLLIAELEEHLDDGIPGDRLLRLIKDTNQHEYLLAARYASVDESVEGRRLVASEQFKILRSKYDDSETFAKHLFGVVFASNYDAITARLRPMKSYVRSALTYYKSCYEFGEMFEIESRDLERRYSAVYGGGDRRLSSFRYTQLPELCDYGILTRRGSRFYGYSEIYDKFESLAADKVPVTIRIPVES